MRTMRGLFLALSILAASCGDSGGSDGGNATAGIGAAAGVGGAAAAGVSGTTAGVMAPAGMAGAMAPGGTAGAMAPGGTAGVMAPTGTAGAMAPGGVAGMLGATAGTMSAGAGGGQAGAMATAGTGATAGGPPVTGTGMFTVEAQLASDVQPSSPGTIGIVTWSTMVTNVTEARVEFGLDTSYGMEAPVDLTEPDYRTLLLGMKPSQTYHFRVVAADGTTEYASDDFTIDTGAPAAGIDIDYQVLDAAGHEPGFIVTSTRASFGTSYAFIVDVDGEIVWWHDFGSSGIARARMSADGKNMWMVIEGLGGGPVQRVSMDTLDAQTYNATVASHDLTPVSGEKMAYLDYGEADCDSLFEIDPSGATMEIWESDELFGGGGGGGGFPGGCHSNALRYSQAEDVYTFSDLTQDVVSIDRSGNVTWRLSQLLPGGIATLGGRQHGHQLLDESILVFANDGGGFNMSAALEFRRDNGAEIFNYVSGEVTANLGDVQRTPGGNTVVTYSNSGILHEVDADGNLVMRLSMPGVSLGYALFRPTLYGPPPDIAL